MKKKRFKKVKKNIQQQLYEQIEDVYQKDQSKDNKLCWHPYINEKYNLNWINQFQ